MCKTKRPSTHQVVEEAIALSKIPEGTWEELVMLAKKGRYTCARTGRAERKQ